ncbi:MAG: hypothetical protein JNG89_16010 [Planctomycetaceae bacterium]|nr:hypothetical protein [Planctomycetaceae bacterium]
MTPHVATGTPRVPLPGGPVIPTDPTRAELTVRDLLFLLAQLVVLSTFVWQFQLDDDHYLLALLLVSTVGFAVHTRLAARAGMAWFVSLSAACLVLVLGWADAACAGAIAAVLIGIAWSPLTVHVRAALLLACAAGLFVLRQDSEQMFWPIVGSMFMFRMLIFVVESRRFTSRPSLLSTAGYFLMLPNIFYPLFPIVDYRTFRDTASQKHRGIYQTGIHWMYLGVAQLLLYRIIKTELLPAPYEVRATRDVVQYLAMNYGLYVRISGQFHLAVGILHLFGFNLRRTHDNYFLASSFTDIWRRINIYWKDFLSTFVFLPAMFRLRGLGNAAAVPVAVLCVFAATWLGHSWQAFWLTGSFPLRRSEAVGWLLVGILVAVNAVMDFRNVSWDQAAPRVTPRTALVRSFRILGVFSAVSLFWAYWSNPEILMYLLHTVRIAGVERPDFVWIGAAALAFVLVALASQLIIARLPSFSIPVMRSRTAFSGAEFDRSVALHLVPAVLLLFISLPPVAAMLGETARTRIANIKVERVSRGDAMAMIDGYYEQLNQPLAQASPFLGQLRRKPVDHFAGEFLSMTRPSGDIRVLELIPGWSGEFDGARTTVNRWGMRDRARSLRKPAQTVRIAMVGSSIILGLGVDDERTISRRLEERLNAHRAEGDPEFEVLNFGMGSTYAVERRATIEHMVLQFDPDVILYFAHQDEMFRVNSNLGNAYLAGRSFEDPALDEIFREAGLSADLSEYGVQAIMARTTTPVLTRTYARMSSLCGDAGVQLVMVYLPIPGEHQVPPNAEGVIEMAQQAGMQTIDLTGWWGDHPTDAVVGVVDKYHPRDLGTQLISEKLESELRARDELLGDRSP